MLNDENHKPETLPAMEKGHLQFLNSTFNINDFHMHRCKHFEIIDNFITFTQTNV